MHHDGNPATCPRMLFSSIFTSGCETTLPGRGSLYEDAVMPARCFLPPGIQDQLSVLPGGPLTLGHNIPSAPKLSRTILPFGHNMNNQEDMISTYILPGIHVTPGMTVSSSRALRAQLLELLGTTSSVIPSSYCGDSLARLAMGP